MKNGSPNLVEWVQDKKVFLSRFFHVFAFSISSLGTGPDQWAHTLQVCISELRSARCATLFWAKNKDFGTSGDRGSRLIRRSQGPEAHMEDAEGEMEALIASRAYV